MFIASRNGGDGPVLMKVKELFNRSSRRGFLNEPCGHEKAMEQVVAQGCVLPSVFPVDHIESSLWKEHGVPWRIISMGNRQPNLRVAEYGRNFRGCLVEQVGGGSIRSGHLLKKCVETDAIPVLIHGTRGMIHSAEFFQEGQIRFGQLERTPCSR